MYPSERIYSSGDLCLLAMVGGNGRYRPLISLDQDNFATNGGSWKLAFVEVLILRGWVCSETSATLDFDYTIQGDDDEFRCASIYIDRYTDLRRTIATYKHFYYLKNGSFPSIEELELVVKTLLPLKLAPSSYVSLLKDLQNATGNRELLVPSCVDDMREFAEERGFVYLPFNPGAMTNVRWNVTARNLDLDNKYTLAMHLAEQDESPPETEDSATMQAVRATELPRQTANTVSLNRVTGQSAEEGDST